MVGSQARILYQDAPGRVAIGLKFNEMVRNGEVGPIMLGRDHHDTGGTDSPFRETANIRDGSIVCTDMATHCFAGNAARGISLVALHNGGAPLAMNGNDLERVIAGVAQIDSIERIRIGTRTLVTMPMRFSDDLVDRLARYRQPGKRQVAVVTHIQHPYEITPETLDAVERLRTRGIPV